MRASIFVLAVVMLAACGSQIPPSATAPTPSTSTMITAEAAATAAAAQFAPGVPVKVLSTRLSTYGAEAGGGLAAADAPVWTVVLSGSFPPFSCGPMTAAPHPCPQPATSALILLDARTGAFFRGTIPAPSPS